MQKMFFALLKGMFVGATMLVPGVSGASMAMILGVYDKLIYSVSSFIKHKKESSFFLGMFSFGGMLGMVLFARPLLLLIERYPKPLLFFFIGAVIGGIPIIYKKAEIKRISWKTLFYPILGMSIVLLLAVIPLDTFQFNKEVGIINLLLLIVAGVIAAVALVLPGISVSYMLLLMGMYDQTMKAISELYFPYLIPLGIGLLLGIILTTKMLEQAMSKFPQATYLTILGFILGSMIEVFPGFPNGMELILCLAMLIAGFIVILILSSNERKCIKNSDKLIT